MNGSGYLGYPENMPENKKMLRSLQFVWHVASLSLYSSLSSFSNGVIVIKGIIISHENLTDVA